MDIASVKINISPITMGECLVLVGIGRGWRGGEGGVNGSNLAALQASNHGHTPPLTPQIDQVLMRGY